MNKYYNSLTELIIAAVRIQRAYRKYIKTKYHHKMKQFLIKRLGLKNIKEKLKRDNSLSSLINGSFSVVEDKRKIEKLFQISQTNRVRLLEAAGYRFYKQDFEKQDKYGYTPLHYAAKNNCLQMCLKMIQMGASVNIKAWDGTTPLHLAFKTNNYQLIQLFIDNGADIDAMDNKGLTPLAFGKLGIQTVVTSNMVVTRMQRSYSNTNKIQMNKQIKLKPRDNYSKISRFSRNSQKSQKILFLNIINSIKNLIMQKKLLYVQQNVNYTQKIQRNK